MVEGGLPEIMRVLLISPSSLQTGQHIPDIGLGYLASAIRNAGFGVEIFQPQKKFGPAVYQKLKESRPDIIGLKVVSLEIPAVRRVISWCRELCPGARIVLGGPHISIAPVEMSMTYFDVDFCIRGEAEISFPQLIQHIHDKTQSLESISGLVYRENGKLKSNPVVIHTNLDDFDMPAWDINDPRKYAGGWYFWSPEYPRAPILTSRGCPYQCTFCAQNIVGGKKLRQRSLDSVFEEMELLIGKYGVHNFDFIDDNFLIRREFVEQFCEGVLNRDWRIKWNCCGARMDIMDPSLIRLMDRAGCNIMSVGYESGSQRMLDYMKKDLDLHFALQQTRMISETSSIKIMGLFIIGYPNETEKEIRKTIRYALKLPIFMATFFTYVVLPGCEETKKLLESGEIDEIPWEKLGIDAHSYSPRGISIRKLKLYYRWALFRFYSRPQTLYRVMRYSWRKTPWFFNHFLQKFSWRADSSGMIQE
jgi:anaerobic magnesium-protoporphyrin IX monomethyl ester cyclase